MTTRSRGASLPSWSSAMTCACSSVCVTTPVARPVTAPTWPQLDDVRATLRARVAAAWRFKPDWHLGAAWSTDILGRKGGGVVDMALSHEIPLSQRTHLALGTRVSWADERYMLARFGISPAAAARTGKPVYQPGGGWRDVAPEHGAGAPTSIGAGRSGRAPTWAACSVPRLDSPLTLKRVQVATGAGFAWRF